MEKPEEIENKTELLETLETLTFTNESGEITEDELEKASQIIREKYTLIKSTSDKFVKERDIVVLKGHMFFIQSISPKKIILKLIRRLPHKGTLVDGIFCYINKEDKMVKIKEVLNSKGKQKEDLK